MVHPKFNPIDYDINHRQVNVRYFLDMMKQGTLVYDLVTPDIRILEYIWSTHTVPLQVFLNYYKEADVVRDENYIYRGYKVLLGNGFFSTLKYFVLDDNIIASSGVFSDFIGLSFSELPRQFQRGLLEAFVDYTLLPENNLVTDHCFKMLYSFS